VVLVACPSSTVNAITYVPLAPNETEFVRIVLAAFVDWVMFTGGWNVAEDGPDTSDHEKFKRFDGQPSSVTVAARIALVTPMIWFVRFPMLGAWF